MPAHVRMGAAIAFAINSGFALLDYFAFPASWAPFLGLRIALNLLFGVVYFRVAAQRPASSQIAICLCLGVAMLMMVYATGGPSSDYYAGLILLFVAMGVVFPLTALESASICGAVTLLYAVSPLVTPAPLDGFRFGIHLVFLLGASVESVASCAFLDRLRFTDYMQRQRIVEANEHLQEMDRLKSRFTANIHHELRTPLTLILAPLESLLGGEFGPLDELQKSYLETARRNALRLLRLINELLELARVESHDRLLRREQVDVGQLAEELVANARPLAASRSVRLGLECERDLSRIYADRAALEKVLVNLLGNALKFTDSGDRVVVRLEPTRSGIEIVVRDTGIGIPPDRLDQVFDRFAQLDSSSTRRYEGTGIGLALSRELVELHGGKIRAESEGPGFGTTIRVTLPLGEPDPEASAETMILDDADEARRRGTRNFDALAAELRDDCAPGTVTASHAGAADAPAADAPEILIVEDNHEMRRIIAHHLGREFRVRLAANGRAGLDAALERPPDLVLTDVMMPELSGTDLCRRLKANPATSAIPVVLLTSKADREHKIMGLELGADDYVQKPFHARELLARVRSLLRVHQLRQVLAERNAALERTNAELRATMDELQRAEGQLIAQERLAAVGELAAGIAHEVNNPVNFACNAVRALQSHVKDIQRVANEMASLDSSDPDSLAEQVGRLQLLQEEVGFDDLTESLDELGRIAGEGIERTARLVGDLRDLGCQRADRRGPVDFGYVLDSTLLLVSHKARDAGITIERESIEDVGELVGDARALSQVVLNLVKNAIEAMEGRRGRIQISLRAAGERAILEVRDEGPGIDPALRDRLFEPFSSTKSSLRSSGLGLSISRRIVEQHGGAIEVESPEAGGACFRILLPRGRSGEMAERSPRKG